MVFLGIDWAEAHHDVCLFDEQGKVLGKRRVVDDGVDQSVAQPLRRCGQGRDGRRDAWR